MKSGKHPKSLKIGIFCAFVLFSIFYYAYLAYNPPAPTRVGNDPYGASLKELMDYRDMLEGQDVVITSTTRFVSWNATSDVMTFHVLDDYFGIDVIMRVENWTTNGAYPISQMTNGLTVVVRGTCYVQSKGYILGKEIHVLQPDLVYLVSISGLVAIIALVLYYFKVDFKKLSIIRKKRETPVENPD